MRAAAIDLGKVRVGLAVADELGMLAHPRPHLDGRNPRALLATLAVIADEEGIGLFLVGLPRTLGGEEVPPARRARRFADDLASADGSSREAHRGSGSPPGKRRDSLREQGLTDREMRSRIDSASAAVLLQSWLDARARSRSDD